MTSVRTYFKENNHVKLTGAAYRRLKKQVFNRDGWLCVDCRSPYNLTLSHKIHKGMGGKKGPGDVPENCVCRCMECHLEEEHGMNGRVKS